MKRKMRRITVALALAGATSLSLPAHASNWLMLQGTQPPGVTARAQFWGFVQPGYGWTGGRELSGLKGGVAGLNGTRPNFNNIGPDQTSSNTFYIRRARIGVRGSATPLSNDIDYFFLAEFGDNALSASRGYHPVITDASVTFNQLDKFVRFRLGLFKIPGDAEEGLMGIPNLPYVNFTNVTNQLLLERFVSADTVTGTCWNSAVGGPGACGPGGNGAPVATDGVYSNVNGLGAFRDTGLMAFNAFRFGPWEYTYGVMVSNGAQIDRQDSNNNKDVNGRLQVSYVFGDSKGPHRSDVSGWVWYQNGDRDFNGQSYHRTREGFGGMVRTGFMRPGAIRASAEYMFGKGMIYAGSPFTSLNGVKQPATMFPGFNNGGRGFYGEGAVFVTRNIQLEGRYDQYDRLFNDPINERMFRTWTFGLQYFINPKTRVTFNYAINTLSVQNPGAFPLTAQGQAQKFNAESIAHSFDNRLDLQVTLIF
ncbi:MAG: porin [Gammaproteobacteria bacterium]